MSLYHFGKHTPAIGMSIAVACLVSACALKNDTRDKSEPLETVAKSQSNLFVKQGSFWNQWQQTYEGYPQLFDAAHPFIIYCYWNWPNSTLPGSNQEADWVDDAINSTWGLVANIRFLRMGACTNPIVDPDSGTHECWAQASDPTYHTDLAFYDLYAYCTAPKIRITISDSNSCNLWDYIVGTGEICGAPHTNELGIAGGNDPHVMTLNFSFNNWRGFWHGDSNFPCNGAGREGCIKDIAIHEFGHALGFSHEQNRPDTPAYCQASSGTARQGEDGTELYPGLTVWDPYSVMNYCSPSGYWQGNGVLSAYDVAGMQHYYGVGPRYRAAMQVINELALGDDEED